MLDDDTYQKLRELQNKGSTQRECAEKLGISRTTVARYWGGKNVPGTYDSDIKPQIKIDKENFAESLITTIEEFVKSSNEDTTDKQKLTAKQAHKYVTEKGMIAGESTVRKYYRLVTQKTVEAFLKLSYIPGQVMQCDWTEISVYLGPCAKLVKINVFCATLCFSKAIFCIPMVNMKFRSMALAHIEAFCFFNGISSEIWYDNMSTNVKQGCGINAVKTDNFKKMEAHYGFESKFMNKGKGNEKGVVENLCGTVKTVILKGILKFDNLQELADFMEKECIKYNETHKIQYMNETIKERYEVEKKELKSLPPKHYIGKYENKRVKVNKHLLFSYSSNEYSAPEECNNKEVTIVEGLYTIEVWLKGEKLAEHYISTEKNKTIVEYKHFLNLLDKKPRARGYAYVVVGGELPKPLDRFRQYLLNKKTHLEELGDTLVLMVNYGIKDEDFFLKAVEDVVDAGDPSYKKIKAKLIAMGANSVKKIVKDYKVADNDLAMYDVIAADKANKNLDDDKDENTDE
ncbi:MAG: IS21 family transposase [Bacteroidales bacterium]|jgi:transcriptional regulator with XRE-family HTH domain|nr:IS21 family transposase [Bacteroidales bacterium]